MTQEELDRMKEIGKRMNISVMNTGGHIYCLYVEDKAQDRSLYFGYGSGKIGYGLHRLSDDAYLDISEEIDHYDATIEEEMEFIKQTLKKFNFIFP